MSASVTAGYRWNSFFKAGEILGEDGAYRIRLAIDGKPYGDYPFTIKGGRIELQGRQMREGTDPQDYITDHISGGRYTSWWLKRELSR